MSRQHTPLPWAAYKVRANAGYHHMFGAPRPDGGYRAIGQIVAGGSEHHRIEANLDLLLRAVNAHDELVETLGEAERQIEYLHEKFGETGTGNAVLARIRAARTKAEGRTP